MIYRNQLQLFFHAASFMPPNATTPAVKRENSPISLTYVAGAPDIQGPTFLTTEKRFFLQLMRAHLQCLVQHQTHVHDLLRFVGAGWDRASTVANEVKTIEMSFHTRTQILDDEHLTIRAALLLPALETKVHLCFSIGASGRGMELEIGLDITAQVMYGEKYKEDRMSEFLMSQIGRGPTDRSGAWVGAIRELEKKLVAQGKKTH